MDERLVASGLNHYLEEPDDSSMQASRQDPAFRNSLQIRKAAMKAIIELDHSGTWTEALRFSIQKIRMCLVFVGHHVFFWKRTRILKGRRTRQVERWYGPGVVIGHEWDQEAERDSYWISYGRICFLELQQFT